MKHHYIAGFRLSQTTDPSHAGNLAVRRAADHEMRACRLLMPDVFWPRSAPDLWVAIDPETSLLVGAAAIAWHMASDQPGFPLHLHVPAALRRRRIATALVQAIVRACAGNAPRLNSWFDVAAESPAAAFLTANGFMVSRRMFEYEAGPQFYPRIKAITDRLRKAGKLPDFQIVSLRQAPAEEVTALIAAHFRTASVTALSGVAQGAGTQDPDRSVVLTDAGRVRGALLYSWNDGDPVIDAWVVAPEARGTAASLMMVEAATRNGLDARAQRFRFSCADDVRDTINLAQRGGAVLTATKLKFSLPLPAASSGEGDQAA